MRVTVCELPAGGEPLAAAWRALCDHTHRERSELLVLPEFAFTPAVWESKGFDAAVWSRSEAQCGHWLGRLGETGALHVIGTRPVSIDGRRYNEGFLWSPGSGCRPLRRKYFLPDETGNWEARWYERGDRGFAPYRAGLLSFGLNICTELWALETYAAYASLRVQAVIVPRATARATSGKWLAAGTVAAVRSGAFCISSNRVHADGSCGGVGWIISPDGEVLAATSPDAPVCTVDIDLSASMDARATYPRYALATAS